ncbi:MAG: hypothetical protein KIT85_20505 [Pseudolabrys sp.]|nr:hypothetical protein [Pseudolabrys sp.]
MNDDTIMAGSQRGQGWRRLALVLLAAAAVGLPINTLSAFAVLMLAVVVAFSGEVVRQGGRWCAAVVILVLAMALQTLLAPPRIEEGHNVFLPSPALEAALPPAVYREMLTAFEARHPASCNPNAGGCWRGGLPERAYAFSADGIWHDTDLSRSATSLYLYDPVRFRLGFINELAYNWYGDQAGLERAVRDRRFWMGFQRWHLTMPWFVMARLPAAYAGGHVCWRGTVLWENEDGGFDRLPHATDACRDITAGQTGRRVFGLDVAPESLTLRVQPPPMVRLQRLAAPLIGMLAVVGLVVVLVRVRWRRLVAPLLLLGLALLVIAIDDASFIGGLRPFDGGDDGLFYDGVGRNILRFALAGDWFNALKGGEAVYYYGGPGLRYFRALEHVIFGETYFGYLTLVLVLPFVAWALFRRFIDDKVAALALALVFVAIPVGVVFGTSFLNYAQWASRGFADPAAYIFFIIGILPIVGMTDAGPSSRLLPAFGGGLAMALAIFMKPIVAPACAVLLAGAGLMALYRRQWPRLVGLCVGFAPVFLITLHNWVYGGVLVLFSANAAHPLVLTMPPSAYGAALSELLHGAIGSQTMRGVWQILGWLRGPSESYWAVPVSLAGVLVALHVALRGPGYDFWLRLIAGTALAQHVVALFYVSTARYHFLAWFLTLVVVAVWWQREAAPWLMRRYPQTRRPYPFATALHRLHTMYAGHA